MCKLRDLKKRGNTLHSQDIQNNCRVHLLGRINLMDHIPKDQITALLDNGFFSSAQILVSCKLFSFSHFCSVLRYR